MSEQNFHMLQENHLSCMISDPSILESFKLSFYASKNKQENLTTAQKNNPLKSINISSPSPKFVMVSRHSNKPLMLAKSPAQISLACNNNSMNSSLHLNNSKVILDQQGKLNKLNKSLAGGVFENNLVNDELNKSSELYLNKQTDDYCFEINNEPSAKKTKLDANIEDIGMIYESESVLEKSMSEENSSKNLNAKMNDSINDSIEADIFRLEELYTYEEFYSESKAFIIILLLLHYVYISLHQRSIQLYKNFLICGVCQI